MNRRLALLLGLCLTTAATRLGHAAEDQSLLIQMGLSDKQGTAWDGKIKVSPGSVRSVEGWRFERSDKILGKDGWMLSTRAGAGIKKGRSNNNSKLGMAKRAAANLGPILDNGVWVRLSELTPESVVQVETKQGNFSFPLSDLKDGEPLDLLGGRVAVQRTASHTRRLSMQRSDDDYPAITFDRKGTGYLLYQSFTPGLDRDERAKRWEAEPKDLSFLAKPAGGDQLWLHVRDGLHWTAQPLAVTEAGGDIYKSALATAGDGTLWIFWSQQQKGQFEILARSFAQGKLGPVQNLSQSPGNDLAPVATCDAQGRVWLAWQAANAEGRFEIRSMNQNSDGQWQAAQILSHSQGNCWQPAIAAGPRGVAVAWDDYGKGDYDIWLWSQEENQTMAVANSPLYEARASLCYDKQGALWIAWEKSGATWGKDWGAYDAADGIGLYRDRQIGLLVRAKGQWMEPVGSLAEALPSAQARRSGKRGNLRGADSKAAPPPTAPELAEGLPADAYLQPAVRRDKAGEHAKAEGWNTFNNLGRLGLDPEGRIWLVVRSRLNSFRGPVGSTWVSYACYLDGEQWQGPMLLPHSDNLSYGVPALGCGSQSLYVAQSTDHRMDRMAEFTRAKDPKGKGGNAALDASSDPFDSDVYVSRLVAAGQPRPAVLKPAALPPQADPKPSARTLAERSEVAAIRNYRSDVGGESLRILRGEFHRHTEISGDAAGDGPLEDMWRYGMDAASMDWIGNGDHDNGNGREYTWWLTQKTTDAFLLSGAFTPMFSYERSVPYPEGHRNCVFAQRGVRTLPRLPISDPKVFAPAPDTLMLYRYLHQFGGVCASHTSVGNMGTDWRNHDPLVEPMVEVYQGARQNYEYPGCPRCPTEQDAIGGWEPAGFINHAFAKGIRFSFQSSSDHGSTHISYAMVYARDASREAILEAMKKRRTYGATDNIIADSRCLGEDGREHRMGEAFALRGAPRITCHLQGTAPFAKVTLIKDNVEHPIAIEPKAVLDLQWTDPKPEPGKTSYYYWRGEQSNGELVWVSPMWIELK